MILLDHAADPRARRVALRRGGGPRRAGRVDAEVGGGPRGRGPGGAREAPGEHYGASAKPGEGSVRRSRSGSRDGAGELPERIAARRRGRPPRRAPAFAAKNPVVFFFSEKLQKSRS